MKVILTSDVKGLGKARDIVDVKSGYFQNYLSKNKLALIASDENRQALNNLLEEERIQAESVKKEALQIKEKLDGKEVALELKIGEGGKLYGAITSKDIAEAIKDQLAIEVDKRKVESGSIKEIGSYDISVKLHSEVESKIKLTIKEA